MQKNHGYKVLLIDSDGPTIRYIIQNKSSILLLLNLYTFLTFYYGFINYKRYNFQIIKGFFVLRTSQNRLIVLSSIFLTLFYNYKFLKNLFLHMDL